MGPTWGRVLATVGALVLAGTMGTVVPTHATSSEPGPARDRAGGKAGEKPYGFTAGGPVLTMSDAALASQLDATVEAGSRWLRMPMSWAVAEASPDEWDWSRLDRVVDAARSRGLKVLGVLGGTPTWASDSGSPAAVPRDPEEFGDFAEAAARHFAGRVRHWEVWNEPNFRLFFTGTPADYAALLAQAHDRITSARRSSTIVLGGLARYAFARSTSPAEFLRGVYDAGGGDHFDVLGVHPYVQAAFSEADDERVWGEVKQARRVMRQAGDGSRKIWVTEVGFSTWLAGWTQERAADQALALLQRARTTRWLGLTVFYSVQDRRTNPAAVHDNYGALLTATGSRKVLFDRLVSAAAGRR